MISRITLLASLLLLPLLWAESVIPVSGGIDLAIWDEDGHTYVAVSMGTADKVLVYKETASNVYELSKTLETPQPYGICAGDFDQDGKNDLAIVSPRRNLTLYLSGNPAKPLTSVSGGMRFFGTPAVGQPEKGNRERILFGAGAVLWSLRQGRVLETGTLRVPRGKPANRCMAFGDVDGDGIMDIAALETLPKNAVRGSLRIYHGPVMDTTLKPEECSRFEEKELPFPVRHIAIGDLDGDSVADIVVSGGAKTWIRRQSGETTLEASGIPHISEGILALVSATGTSFYDGKTLTVRKSDRRGYRSVRIHGKRFFGLGKRDVRIYDLEFADSTLGKSLQPAPPAAIKGEKAVTAPAKAKDGSANKIQPLKFQAAYRQLSKKNTIVEERIKNDPMMFPYYTGTILPTPQQVTYSQKSIPLNDVGIVLEDGLSMQDARVRILTERIVRYGGRCTQISEADAGKHPLVFAIGKTGLGTEVEAPARREGYAFAEVRPGVMAVKYADKLALTWAISSLAQLIDNNSFHPADVTDYPAVARRQGSIPRLFDAQTNWSDYTSPELVNISIYPKFNEFTFPYYFWIPNKGPDNYWRKPRPQKYLDQLRKLAECLNPLGIEWYMGLIAFGKRDSPQQQEWMLDSASDEDFRILFDMSCHVGDLGGNIIFYWEDHRKPIGQADRKNFGSAREADIFLINRLYKALRAKYPTMKFIFAGPFYHGPEGAPSPFSDENRDEYFAGIGERFPKDIDICWTGPRVASTRVTKEHMQWITRLIRRKPAFWQNSADFGRRPRTFYMGDTLNAWKTFYYEGFYDDICSYTLNYSQPCLSHPCGDFLWNPKAYDAEKSRDEVLMRYVGRENLPIVMEMHDAMNAFNRYEFRLSPAAVRDHENLRRNARIAVDAYHRILRNRPATEVLNMNFMIPLLNRIIGFVDKLEAKQDLSEFTAPAEDIRKAAVKEADFNTKSDLLFTAFELTGSNPVLYKQRYKTRTYSAAKYSNPIFGKGTIFHTLHFEFNAIPWPAEDDYEILLCGLDDDAPAQCPIRICINGKEIFKGPSPFRPDEWSVAKFRIPSPMVFRGNKVTIENLSESGNLQGPPFVCISYAIMRKLDPQ